MPHKSTVSTGFIILGLGLIAPSALQAQAVASMAVSATVLSAEAMRSWQAVAARLGARVPDGQIRSATLATIAERTERTLAGVRRVVSVEYLRN